MRDKAGECPSSGKTCEEIILTYCCDKSHCESRSLLREEREKRERQRLRERTLEKRRARQKAAFERWEKAWVQEEMGMGEEERLSSESKKYMKEMRLLMEDKRKEEQESRESHNNSRELWEFWEDMWVQDGMTVPKAAEAMEKSCADRFSISKDEANLAGLNHSGAPAIWNDHMT